MAALIRVFTHLDFQRLHCTVAPRISRFIFSHSSFITARPAPMRSTSNFWRSSIPMVVYILSKTSQRGCRPGSGWNWAWRILRKHEGIVSGCEVNRLIARLYGERLPSIDLAHVDLSRGEQRPEQHGCGVC